MVTCYESRLECFLLIFYTTCECRPLVYWLVEISLGADKQKTFNMIIHCKEIKKRKKLLARWGIYCSHRFSPSFTSMIRVKMDNKELIKICSGISISD